MARGDELLIVDGTAAHRDGMRTLFEEAGYVCTAVDSIAQARDLLEKKFFPAALIDLDVERPGAGIDLVRIVSERSPHTAVVLLTGRRSFEAAVEAHRLGVNDVIVKRPDQIEQLKHAVDVACERYRATQGTELLRDVASVLDDAFHILLKHARDRYDPSSGAGAPFRPRILVVDPDRGTLKQLAKLLKDKPWDVLAEMSGGGALEKAHERRIDVIACCEELPDLRGPMVIKSLQAQHGEAVGLVYSQPGGEGHIVRYLKGRAEDAERPYSGPPHLVRRIEQIIEQLGATVRDRKIIQAFRAENADFFRRFAELKLRIGRLID